MNHFFSTEAFIPTISGLKTLSAITLNDMVYDCEGNECSILFIRNIVLDKECYQIIFNYSEQIIACVDCNWSVSGRGIVSTRNLNINDNILSPMLSTCYTITNIQPIQSVPLRGLKVNNLSGSYLITECYIPTLE